MEKCQSRFPLLTAALVWKLISLHGDKWKKEKTRPCLSLTFQLHLWEAKCTFSWRLEELAPFIGLMWLFYPLLVIPLWDCVCAAAVGLCVVRAVSQPPGGFGFPAVLQASPSCISQAVPSREPPHSYSLQERRTCSAPATSLPTARMSHTGAVLLIPNLWPIPREHCNRWCRISPSSLPFPAALWCCTLNFLAQKMGINAEKSRLALPGPCPPVLICCCSARLPSATQRWIWTLEPLGKALLASCVPQ